MKIGDRVKTKHGTGIITGFDLSDSTRAKRCIVKMAKWNKNYDFGVAELCYFPKDIKKID